MSGGKESLNHNHPEKLCDEVWLTNTSKGDYHKISYRTKRMGKIGRSSSGYILKNIYPVFVRKAEYDERMMCIRRERRRKFSNVIY